MQLVGIREAARAVGLSHSTISRQVAAGIIPNRGSERRPLVDVAEVRAARARQLDPSRQGNAAGRLLGDPAADLDGELPLGDGLDERDEGEAGGRGRSGGGDASYRSARTAREGYQAALARIQYEERTGQLVNRAEVHEVMMGAARQLRDVLLRLGDRIAGEVAGLSDPADCARVINREHRAALEALSEAFRQLGEGS